jgi:hypothetical protein
VCTVANTIEASRFQNQTHGKAIFHCTRMARIIFKHGQNKIYRITRFIWGDFIWGYMTASTWYQDFFTRNFAWLLAVARGPVALSAMQVVLPVARSGRAFEDVSYSFSVSSLLLVAGFVLVVLVVRVVLFAYHLVSTQMNNRKVMSERRSFADIKG